MNETQNETQKRSANGESVGELWVCLDCHVSYALDGIDRWPHSGAERAAYTGDVVPGSRMMCGACGTQIVGGRLRYAVQAWATSAS